MMDEIDVYPVGLLWDIKHHRLFRGLRDMVRHLRYGSFRAAKSHFNGYLAEYVNTETYRCGSGWTKKRAIRSLERQERVYASDG